MICPTVSVLITVYNREALLPKAIESVLAQTFADFEVIVVDDCSSDRSRDVAREYERRDARVRVHENARNLGDYGNRNVAAGLARGEFLKYHDSDDVMYPHCLAVMVEGMRAHPTAGFGLSGHRAWPGGPVPMLLTPKASYQREFLGFGLFMCGPASAIFRTNVFRELGGFTDHGTPSDTIFWMRACARYPVLLLPGDLFYYREHPAQELHSAKAARQYATVAGHLWRSLSSPDCPLDEHERRLARRNVAYSVAKSAWQAMRLGDPSLALFRLTSSSISPLEWCRYLRPPTRSTTAGVRGQS